ncbi:MAG: pyridoxal phosphate-dependent aminotransferase [bacterium]
MIISEKAKNVAGSGTLAISSKAKELKNKGFNLINLSVGEPDFDTPDYIKEAIIKALREGKTKYTDASGIIELKGAIAKKLKTENGLNYSPDQIIVSSGAKHSITNILFSLLNPEDCVIIPSPYWVSYAEMVKFADGIPIIVKTTRGDGFKLSKERLKEAITEKTKGIILNSPSNPTGAVYTEKELLGIASVIKENNLWVISDEVYEKFVYDGLSHKSIAQFIPENTVVINGFSKTYAMTGLRIGYAAGPIDLIKAAGRIQSQTTSNPCSVLQYGALAAITSGNDFVLNMVSTFEKRRRLIVDGLNQIKGMDCPMPQGAFYAFCDVSGLFKEKIKGSSSLAEFLIEEAKVALVPGVAFGDDNYLRLSYAASTKDIEEGILRIKEAISHLQ